MHCQCAQVYFLSMFVVIVYLFSIDKFVKDGIIKIAKS
jgi:hypothetical protein